MRKVSLWMGIVMTGFSSSVMASPDSVSKRPDLALGIEMVQQERWSDALGQMLKVLTSDPSNPEAHAYLNLIAQKISSTRSTHVREIRLDMLTDASKRLDRNRLDAHAIDQALLEGKKTEARYREESLHAQCVMAQMENHLGHLAAANDLVLRVLLQDANNPEAQRMLSDLQSQIRETLDSGENLSDVYRYSLEGFYAYGQADYQTALAAWTKVRETLGKETSANIPHQQIASLHFEAYEKVAQRHIEEEDRVHRLQELFNEAVARYENHQYTQALERFRQIALTNPEYPQLATYLVQSESKAEQERTHQLTQEKKDRANQFLNQGLMALEKNQYKEAQHAFKQVLLEDPSNPQAISYLAVVETEMNRRHDPRAAQSHYESGLISYASGRLNEALREWRITLQLDPTHEKAANALSKVEKEIAMNREVPE